ncbi:MAG: hypothetical protein Q4F28_00785 [Eubacteriales bacterium]|nr:hypothetical protein [Eubacteriales bacterium]
MKRLILMTAGVFLIGFGGAMLRLSSLGTDPFTCMNLGISSIIGIPYGTSQLLFNLLLMIPMLIWYRKGLGIGTIFNMAALGYISDFCVSMWGHLGITAPWFTEHMILRFGFLLAAIPIFCLGVASYMESDLGIAPYDALGQIIEQWTNRRIRFSTARVITDVLAVLIGFSAGSVVGIATVITAFFTGPVVGFFRKKVRLHTLSV